MNNYLLLSLLLCSFNIGNAQQNKNIPFNYKLIPFWEKDSGENSKMGYVDSATRKVIVQPVYRYVDFFVGNVAKVAIQTPSWRYGLIDTTGKLLLDTIYNTLDYARAENGSANESRKDLIPGLFVAMDNKNNYGVLSSMGAVIPMGKYKKFVFYSRDTILCDQKYLYANGNLVKLPGDLRITFINNKQHFIEVQKNSSFLPENTNGIIKLDGTTLLKPQYLEINYYPKYKRFVASRVIENPKSLSALTKFLTKVIVTKETTDDIKDYIINDIFDETGKLIASYKSAEDMFVFEDTNEGTFDSQGKKYSVNIESGKLISTQNLFNPKSLYNAFKENDKWGVKDSTGHIIIEPNYTSVKCYKETIIAQESSTFKFGVIDASNNILLPFIYADITFSGDDLKFAIITAQTNYYASTSQGIMNRKTFKIIIPTKKYSQIKNPDKFGNREVINDSIKSGLIDNTGQVILPCIYSSIDNKNYKIKSNAYSYLLEQQIEAGVFRHGLADSTGKIILPVKYKEIEEKKCENGLLPIANADGLWGSFDLGSKAFKLPCEYTSLEVYDYFVLARKNGFYQFFNHNGNLLLPNLFKDIKKSTLNGYIGAQDSKTGKWGIVDGLTANKFYDHNYDDIFSAGIGLAPKNFLKAVKGNQAFLFDSKGKEYYPIK